LKQKQYKEMSSGRSRITGCRCRKYMMGGEGTG